MKTKFMATAAVVAILAATGAARADEIGDIKAQSIALKKQNAALEARLNKLEKQQAKQEKKIDAKVAVAPAGQPAPESFIGMVTKGPLEVINDDGPICWKGVCVFGTIDAGVGYVSHGFPMNGDAYFGEALITKNANRAYFGIAPSGLSQSTLGIKGATEIMPGLSGVFYASTGINPQSGQLANAEGSLIDQNGLNRQSYSLNADGSRGGQAFNDQLYAGLASANYGQLTFGRHKTFSNDIVGAYDPAGGSYNYSVIGYSGTPVAGMGDTGAARLNDTFKYRVEYGPIHFGAMYKFADGNGGSSLGAAGVPANLTTNNWGYQFNLGGKLGGFEADATAGQFKQVLSMAALASGAGTGSIGGETFTSNTGVVSAVTTGGFGNTLAATATDNTGAAIAAKYTWNQFKFYAGYSYVHFANPQNNVGSGASAQQGDYVVSTINNHPYAANDKILQTEWAGVKYAYDARTDITVAYYHEGQNQFATAANTASCSLAIQSARNSACAGDLHAVSAYVDYHFNKRFDVYGGMMFSVVTGGLSSGYLYSNNFAPSAGVRFTF